METLASGYPGLARVMLRALEGTPCRGRLEPPHGAASPVAVGSAERRDAGFLALLAALRSSGEAVLRLTTLGHFTNHC